jgi:prepilin-type N-terminal cleavage/methylation domain-containing protein
MRTSTAARPVQTCRVDRGGVCLSTGTGASPRRAFTLVELLVVMGIVGVLAVIVGLGVSKAATGARIAAATNDVIAALAQARAIAVRDRTQTVVAFRVYQPTRRDGQLERPDFSKAQQTEIVIAKGTGRVLRFAAPVARPGAYSGFRYAQMVPPSTPNANDDILVEEFWPVEGIQPKRLPPGIKVALPASDLTQGIAVPNSAFPAGSDQSTPADWVWLSQPELKNAQIAANGTISNPESASMLMIRFGPDGKPITRNPSLPANVTPGSDIASVRPWVDFNRDGFINIGTSSTGGSDTMYYNYDEWDDEPLGNCGLFIAVFNDAELRERSTPAAQVGWRGTNSRELNFDRTVYIDQNADRIQFNRFTGVAEVVPQ